MDESLDAVHIYVLIVYCRMDTTYLITPQDIGVVEGNKSYSSKDEATFLQYGLLDGRTGKLHILSACMKTEHLYIDVYASNAFSLGRDLSSNLGILLQTIGLDLSDRQAINAYGAHSLWSCGEEMYSRR